MAAPRRRSAAPHRNDAPKLNPAVLQRNSTSFPARATAKLRELHARYLAARADPADPEHEWATLLHYYQFVSRAAMSDPEFGIGADGNGRGLLGAHSTGLGKTRLAAAVTAALWQEDRPVVVMLPRSLRANFAATLADVAARLGESAPIRRGLERMAYVSMDAYNSADQMVRAGTRPGGLPPLESGTRPGGLPPLESGAGAGGSPSGAGAGAVSIGVGGLDDKLLVVDEAHDFFRAIVNGGAESNARRLYEMIQAARNLRLLFLTGTPITKNPFEIVPCFNMLAGRDLLPVQYEIFCKLYVDAAAHKVRNREKLANRLVGLVSYVSHERPTAPVAEAGAGAAPKSDRDDGWFPEELPTVVERVEMGPAQYRAYLLAREKEEAEGKGGEGGRRPAGALAAPPLALPGAEKKAGSTYYVRSRTLSLFAPAREWAATPVAAMPAAAFTPEAGPKLRRIAQLVDGSPGPALVYSQFVEHGLKPLGRYLEQLGYAQYVPTLPPKPPSERIRGLKKVVPAPDIGSEAAERGSVADPDEVPEAEETVAETATVSSAFGGDSEPDTPAEYGGDDVARAEADNMVNIFRGAVRVTGGDATFSIDMRRFYDTAAVQAAMSDAPVEEVSTAELVWMMGEPHWSAPGEESEGKATLCANDILANPLAYPEHIARFRAADLRWPLLVVTTPLRNGVDFTIADGMHRLVRAVAYDKLPTVRIQRIPPAVLEAAFLFEEDGATSSVEGGEAGAAANPPLVIQDVEVRGKTLHIVRDDSLEAGTKQRAAPAFVASLLGGKGGKPNVQTILYTAPYNGYGPVAAAFAARALGLRCHLVLARKAFGAARASSVAEVEAAETVRRARALGATVELAATWPRLVAAGKAYARRPGVYWLPLGFQGPGFSEALADAIGAAAAAASPPAAPRRVWVAGGTGALAAALARAFPGAEVRVVPAAPEAAAKVAAATAAYPSVRIVADPPPHEVEAPYPTVAGYDERAWDAAVALGEDGDYVWNVGHGDAGAPTTPRKTGGRRGRAKSPGGRAHSTERARRAELARAEDRAPAADFPYRAAFMPPAAEMFGRLREIARAPPAEWLAAGEAEGKLAVVRRSYPEDFDATDSVTDHFVEPVRIGCRERGEPSPAAAWAAARERPGLPTEVREQRELVYRAARGCNLFNAALATYLAARFGGAGGAILDATAGWGDRLGAAFAAGARTYRGWDTNPDLQPVYAAIAAAFGPLAAETAAAPLDWSVELGPFERAARRLADGGDLHAAFDMAFLCPPYFDKEVYQGPGTSSEAHPTEERWHAEFYRPALRACAAGLRPGGHLCAYVPPGRMRDEAAAELAAAGLEYAGAVGFQQVVAGKRPIDRDTFVWRRPAATGGAKARKKTPAPATDTPLIQLNWTDVPETPRAVIAREWSAYAFVLTLHGLLPDSLERSVFVRGCGAIKEWLFESLLETRLPPGNWALIRATATAPIAMAQLVSTLTALGIDGEGVAKRLTDAVAKCVTSEPYTIKTATLVIHNDSIAFRVLDPELQQVDAAIGRYSLSPSRAGFHMRLAGNGGALLRKATANIIKSAQAVGANARTFAALMVVRAALRHGSLGGTASGPPDLPHAHAKALYAAGVRNEAFTTPFSSRLLPLEKEDTTFCSLFLDTDYIFGGIGCFFEREVAELAARPGGWSAGLPYSGSVVDFSAKCVLALAEAPAQGPVFCLLPDWASQAVQAVAKSPATIHVEHLDAGAFMIEDDSEPPYASTVACNYVALQAGPVSEAQRRRLIEVCRGARVAPPKHGGAASGAPFFDSYLHGSPQVAARAPRGAEPPEADLVSTGFLAASPASGRVVGTDPPRAQEHQVETDTASGEEAVGNNNTEPGVVPIESTSENPARRGVEEEWAAYALTQHLYGLLPPHGRAHVEARNAVERWLLAAANEAPWRPGPWALHRAALAAPAARRKLAAELAVAAKLGAAGGAELADRLVAAVEAAVAEPPPEPALKIATLTADGLTVVADGETATFALAGQGIALLRRAVASCGDGAAPTFAVARMALRYAAAAAGGQQLGLPRAHYAALYAAGVRNEAFASPLNSRLLPLGHDDTRFWSLFPDTDAPFGSQGRFFDTADVAALAALPGDWTVNPPYVEALMAEAADRVLAILEAAAAGEQRRVFFLLPAWDDAAAVRRVLDSPRAAHVERLRPGAYSLEEPSGRVFAAPFGCYYIALLARPDDAAAAEAADLCRAVARVAHATGYASAGSEMALGDAEADCEQERGVLGGAERSDAPPKGYYAIISGEVDPAVRAAIVAAATSPANAHGAVIKGILVSKTGAQGLDLKFLRRAIVAEPYWDESRHGQVRGRARRLGSHDALPRAERDVRPYVMLAVPSREIWEQAIDKEAKTIDEIFYDRAISQHQTIADFRRLLAEVSLECTLYGYGNCRACVPTGAPLFHADPALDVRLPDPCRTCAETQVDAAPIELDGTTYYYIADPASALGYIFYAHRADLGGYAALDPTDPVVARLLTIVA